MSKITKEDYKNFKKDCQYWLREFGLQGWFQSITKDGLDDCYGEVWWDNNKRVLEISLNVKHEFKNEKEKKEFLKRTAVHECLEVLVGSSLERIMKEWKLMKYKPIEDEIIFEEERHNIIRVLENLLYNKEIKNEFFY